MKKIILLIICFISFSYKVNASFIVMNQDNHEVLSGDNIHQKRLIASISKVMTAYIVIKYTDINKYITISEEVLKSHGSSIYLKVGERIKVKDLLYGLLLRSGNDAALALALYASSSVDDFVKLMNKEANLIGMKDTLFQNPSGLDDEDSSNISTAYDMALLTSTAMKNNVFKDIFKTKKYTVKTNLNYHIWYSKNKTLFLSKYITGGKTGYTKKAKRTLITTASKDNMNVVVVTLNQADDFRFHLEKYKNIFLNYKNYLLFNRYMIKADNKHIKNKYLYSKNNFYYLCKESDLENISSIYNIYKMNNYINNTIVGEVIIKKKDEILFKEPIYYFKPN